MTHYRTISTLLLSALLLANNLHLPFLQVVAWCGMLVSYSRDNSAAEAIEMTFDGDHPCPMCKAIKKAQRSSGGNTQLAGPKEGSARETVYVPAPALTTFQPCFVRQRVSIVHRSCPEALFSPPRTPPPISA